MEKLNSALFIDYDNVRTELERYDPGVAARFSNKTLVWLDALEKELESAEQTRRIVSRRCYASPQRIQSYRRSFTQTGFEVIDCPPLTTHLKNSADIYIVMDVVDYLSRYPHIDEYIILSGDADFVPVLNRLRRELKRSVIFASYNTTAAYRNCSDQRIEVEFFAEHLAIKGAAAPTVEAAAAASAADLRPMLDPALSDAIETCLVRAAARRAGRLPFSAAGLALRQDMKAELGEDWAGRRTFTAMLEKAELKRLRVDWGKQEIEDPNFTPDLPDLDDWDESDLAVLRSFVLAIAVASRKPIPTLPPHAYRLIFQALAEYYDQDEPGTVAEATRSVAELCRARGVDATAFEIGFISTGISMQGYRFSDREDAAYLASLWRTQVFYLCGEPDWMREPEEAERLATWFRADDETIEGARDDFLRETDDSEDPAEDKG